MGLQTSDFQREFIEVRTALKLLLQLSVKFDAVAVQLSLALFSLRPWGQLLKKFKTTCCTVKLGALL